jgi:hypothetical protein
MEVRRAGVAGVGFEISCDHALSPLFFLFLLV